MPNLDGALCRGNARENYWLSYVEAEVECAKSICMECPVISECALLMMMQYAEGDIPVGVFAGTSEFDRLESLWKEVGDGKESNWSGFDSLIPEGM